jgi:YgiT-type zinc finger domain-containing protein
MFSAVIPTAHSLKLLRYTNLISRNGMTALLKGDLVAMATNWQETLVEKQVTYTLNLNGQIILIENVPARVNEETGEQFFSPSTVERLQQTILDKQEPDRFIQVPVYSYSDNVA